MCKIVCVFGSVVEYLRDCVIIWSVQRVEVGGCLFTCFCVLGGLVLYACARLLVGAWLFDSLTAYRSAWLDEDTRMCA